MRLKTAPGIIGCPGNPDSHRGCIIRLRRGDHWDAQVDEDQIMDKREIVICDGEVSKKKPAGNYSSLRAVFIWQFRRGMSPVKAAPTFSPPLRTHRDLQLIIAPFLFGPIHPNVDKPSSSLSLENRSSAPGRSAQAPWGCRDACRWAWYRWPPW